MTHQHEDELRPEDHWPEAERLLDTHFKRKRRRSLIIFFALLLLGTWGGYTLFQNGGGTLPKYDISAERNGVSAAENTSEASIENSEGTEESNTLGLKDVTPSTSEKTAVTAESLTSQYRLVERKSYKGPTRHPSRVQGILLALIGLLSITKRPVKGERRKSTPCQTMQLFHCN